jgi:hypothetical protein
MLQPVAGVYEGITVVARPLEQLARDLDEGRMVDGKFVTLILALRLRRPELFIPHKSSSEL